MDAQQVAAEQAAEQEAIDFLHSSRRWLVQYWKAYVVDRKYVAKNGGLDTKRYNRTLNARLVSDALDKLLFTHAREVYISKVDDVDILMHLKSNFGWNGVAVCDQASEHCTYDIWDKLTGNYMDSHNRSTGERFDADWEYQVHLEEEQY